MAALTPTAGEASDSTLLSPSAASIDVRTPSTPNTPGVFSDGDGDADAENEHEHRIYHSDGQQRPDLRRVDSAASGTTFATDDDGLTDGEGGDLASYGAVPLSGACLSL